MVDYESVSTKKLKRILNKFVYHQNLNNKYWVGIDGNVVKIKKYRHSKKKEKKQETFSSTIKQGW